VSGVVTISEPTSAKAGRLVLVVGPSGAGKDTLIDLAQAACADDDRVVFPRRVVTRQASEHEANDSVSPEQFESALARGEFALHWDAHGLRYGVPRAIDDELAAGRTVVVNVSRTVIVPARQSYGNVTVVLITAPPDILASRLALRKRDSDGRLDARLGRAVDMSGASPDVVISNIDRAEDHARDMLAIIRGDHARRA
jgi:ribose 1,5-bisphosphokinase